MKIYEELQQQYQKYGNIQNLMKYFNDDELTKRFKSLKNRAPGVDGVTKYDYGKNLESNIDRLVSSIRSGSYTPKDIRRCYIPKANGKLRPLGIPTTEDRIVQGVMADILYSIYDPLFLECSFGYRLNQNALSALSKFKTIAEKGKTYFIVKADIKGFFDNVNHIKLLEMLKENIQDKHFISLTRKFLKANIFYKDKLFNNKSGTPQGGLISPVLGNIYLHYALDVWFDTEIKAMFPYTNLIRYCDDFIASFATKSDATLFITAVQKRLKEYHLDLELEKTNIIKFDIRDTSSEILSFLGFNIFVDMNNHLCFRASYHKLQQKVTDISDRFMDMLNKGYSVIDCLLTVNDKLRGCYNYYGVSTNPTWIQQLYEYTGNCIMDILYYNEKTKQMSYDQLYNLLLYKLPILSPPVSLIQL